MEKSNLEQKENEKTETWSYPANTFGEKYLRGTSWVVNRSRNEDLSLSINHNGLGII